MLNDGSASHQATGMISKPYAGDPDSDELTVKRGQLISSFTKLSDPKWMTVTILAGEKGECVRCSAVRTCLEATQKLIALSVRRL